MQLDKTLSKMVSTETPISATNLARNKSDVARPKKSGSRRRKSARVLRSSSKVDASRPQSTLMPSTIYTRSSRRSGANVSVDRSLRRSKRIIQPSDDSVREDVDSLAFVSSDSIEESDSGIMTVDSDTLTGDFGCKPVGLEQPFTENDEGETQLSRRLDFQSKNIVFKKKRKPNRKRHNNDTVKPDVVVSDACVSPTFSEKSAQKYARDDGDQHLPLVKRARVRMGMSSPTAEEEVTLVLKEDKMSEAPGGLITESSEPLGLQVERADTVSVPVREVPTFSSLSHASLMKPILSEARKNYVDGEAALPPSKRLHRALEAMSANVAEDCERASDCLAAPNIQSNSYCPSFLESSELSMGKRPKVKLESKSTENLRNGDSLANVSEFCIMSDAKTPKYDTETVLNCVKTQGIESSDPVLTDNKCLKLPMSNDAPAETDAEYHVKQDSLNVGEHSTCSNCNIADELTS